MKQAILILAHKDFQQILRLSKRLITHFEIYIHFDAKFELTQEQKDTLLNTGIHFIQQYSVHWGAWSVCQAVLAVLHEALKDPEIGYFHFISGQDWPVKSSEEIFNYYQANSNIYMKYRSVVGVKETGEPIEWCQKYYFDYDRIPRQTLYGILYHRLTLLKQTIKRTNKLKDLNISLSLYQGSQWVDMPRDAAEYIVTYLQKHPEVQKMLSTGFCSDEFMFQTLLCNSPLANRLVNNNHRLIKLVKQHDSYPAILDESNYDEIISGDYHFVRKIDSTYSATLIDMIERHCKQKEI